MCYFITFSQPIYSRVSCHESIHTAGTLETDVAHLSIIVAVTSLVPNLKKNTPWLCMCVGGDVKAKERKKKKKDSFSFSLEIKVCNSNKNI